MSWIIIVGVIIACIIIVIGHYIGKTNIDVEEYLTEEKKIKAFDFLVPEKNFIVDDCKIELKYSGIEIHDNYFMRNSNMNVISAKAYVIVEGIEVYDWCTIKFGEIIRCDNEEFKVRNRESEIENATRLLKELNQAVQDYKTLKKVEEIVDRKQLM